MNSVKNIKLRVWIIFIVGIAMVSTTLYLRTLDSNNNYSEVLSFGLHLGKTFIAAGIIALVMRVPSLLKDVDRSAINLLRSNEFLKRLDEKQLLDLRVAATENAYLKTANSVNPSLGAIDKKISTLFLEPYYQHFNVNCRCKVLQSGHLEKLFSTHFVFMNPNKEPFDATDALKMRVVQTLLDNTEQEKHRVLMSVQIIKENKGSFVDCTSKFKLEFSQHTEEESNYNIASTLGLIGKSDYLQFQDSIQVKIVEKRLIPISDKVYINRINSPTEKLNVNYSFENCDVELLGTGFATFHNTKDGGINIFKDGNSIHIGCDRWLLTGNGIMIVHDFNEIHTSGGSNGGKKMPQKMTDTGKNRENIIESYGLDQNNQAGA